MERMSRGAYGSRTLPSRQLAALLVLCGCAVLLLQGCAATVYGAASDPGSQAASVSLREGPVKVEAKSSCIPCSSGRGLVGPWTPGCSPAWCQSKLPWRTSGIAPGSCEAPR